MQHYNRWIIAVAVAALSAVGCERSPGSAKAVAAVAGKPQEAGLGRIKLSDTEARHLGIEFAELTREGERLVAPYDTLLYDASGREWVYVGSEPNVFLRTEVKVEAIEGNKVYLAQGPAVGTRLVTSGAAELYGIEFGVGK